MVKKAVIPAAGSGTRFLPATKAQPKEMLPIIDTPTIQYVVQEAVDSGIDDILIITGKGKRAIEDHFDRHPELELMLDEKNEGSLSAEMRRIADMANIHFIRQKEPIGLGDAVRYARHHTGSEPFAVLLGDTIIRSEVPASRQLIDCYNQYGQTIIAVETVPREKVSRYGIVDGTKINESVHKVKALVEKPSPAESPSTLAIAGRYVLTPEIFEALEGLPRGQNNEVQLTDALRVLQRTRPIYSITISGRRYDIGDKLDYLKTQVEYGLVRKEFSGPFRKFLNDLLES
jgi:UTP--glucose-1-phosphate uridylyltransferase